MLEWLRKAIRPGAETAAACAAHDAGDWQRAVTLLQPLAHERPDDAEMHYRLGDALYQLERAQEALAPLERAARLAGNVAAHQYKLGNALKDLERLEEALACYRRALELEPRHAQSLNNTGVILELQGRTDEALHYYRQAILADGTLLPALGNLAVLLHKQERFSEETEAYQSLLRIRPQSAGDWCDLGNACVGLERHDGAIRCYERALALNPAPADTSRGQRRFDDALDAFERGPGLGLNLPELLNNLGAAYKHQGALETAERCFKRAVVVSPLFTLARTNLATVRYSLGLVVEAIAGYREILKIEPQNAHAARHLLMALLYTPCSAEDLFAEHLAFARRLGSGTPVAPVRRRSAGPGRKIRIGYVSSDLRRHPVGHNLAPIIRLHDRNCFEVYLYSGARQPDEMSRWFRGQATAWRSIAYLSDEVAAQQVRQDEIDILVLLAGRFDDNRPLLATYRAAPVQVSMHDPATSGLAEMDYLIADRALVPRHTTEKFTERVVCLPTFFLHPPLDEAPHDPEPPAARHGRITFGSFNNLPKINEGVVAAWAKVLLAVPGSRLLLKYMDIYTLPSVRSRYVGLFGKYGIEEERLIIPGEGAENRADHFSRYLQVDIALDPFPFTGSTTTFEALWMGVPVVTLEGGRMVARWSAAMLRKVGLPHLIARNEADYVEIARELAANPGELARLRAELRDRVARSPLCAEQARTRQLERLYRRMWKIWADKQEHHA